MSSERSLQTATTLRVGGVPRFWESVTSPSQLVTLIQQTDADGTACRILGGGSNVLAREGALDCAVVEIRNQNIAVEEDGDMVLVTVGAGVLWDDLVGFTVENGWWGLENLSAIPGTVGAAPVQNVGAYGVELSEVCVSAHVYDRAHMKFLTFQASDMQFAYRSSLFKRDPLRYVIWDVAVRLSKKPSRQLAYKDLEAYFGTGSIPSIAEVRGGIMAIRRGKFPDISIIGTAGSFFKNPIISREMYEGVQKQFPQLPHYAIENDTAVKIPIAYILEQLGYKGHRDNSVGMHDAHALVLVTYDGATSIAVDAFAKKIEKSVESSTGIVLEREVQFFP